MKAEKNAKYKKTVPMKVLLENDLILVAGGHDIRPVEEVVPFYVDPIKRKPKIKK
ncbi:hypothetical protein [Aliiglaciecola sp. M165]|uniref:hypothetical protein n=1 Tax=Aliiglaciecola sp. M165 TaxID=2593649 RepID=UPI00163DDC24|nr:hypothetical protein [Aliiglaciecola sp. M165]